MSNGSKVVMFFVFMLLAAIVIIGAHQWNTSPYAQTSKIMQPEAAPVPDARIPFVSANTQFFDIPDLNYILKTDEKTQQLTGIVSNDSSVLSYEFVYLRLCEYDKDDVQIQWEGAVTTQLSPKHKWKFVAQLSPFAKRTEVCTAFAQRN